MLIENQEETIDVLETSYKSSKKQKNKQYKIVLVTPTSIIYDDNGVNRFVRMKSDFKVGDFISI